MTLKNYIFIFSVFSLFVLSSCKKGNPQAEKIAVEAANQWLNLIDNGEYGESWELAAGLFKKALGKNRCLRSENLLVRL